MAVQLCQKGSQFHALRAPSRGMRCGPSAGTRIRGGRRFAHRHERGSRSIFRPGHPSTSCAGRNAERAAAPFARRRHTVSRSRRLPDHRDLRVKPSRSGDEHNLLLVPAPLHPGRDAVPLPPVRSEHRRRPARDRNLATATRAWRTLGRSRSQSAALVRPRGTINGGVVTKGQPRGVLHVAELARLLRGVSAGAPMVTVALAVDVPSSPPAVIRKILAHVAARHRRRARVPPRPWLDPILSATAGAVVSGRRGVIGADPARLKSSSRPAASERTARSVHHTGCMHQSWCTGCKCVFEFDWAASIPRRPTLQCGTRSSSLLTIAQQTVAKSIT